ncbi:MAG: heavy-metal-associated domain-containing protein [Rudanella sp.]|nr:heavy-metal-associated domain-containing protein [Rudanella sp.]
METLNRATVRFKTNIKCGGCIAAVTPFLNAIEQLDGWNVDTANPDKILTVQTTDTGVGDEVRKAVERAGYKAEPMP